MPRHPGETLYAYLAQAGQLLVNADERPTGHYSLSADAHGRVKEIVSEVIAELKGRQL